MKSGEFRGGREQIRVLSNPKRMAIHTTLRSDGPATARELAERLALEELSLYYHLRLMVKSGLLVTETRATATKPEAVYSSRGRMLVDQLDLDDPADLHEACRNVDVLTRTAAKEYRAAATTLQNDFLDINMVARIATRMTPEKFEEFRLKIREVLESLDDGERADGERFGISLFVSPLLSSRAPEA